MKKNIKNIINKPGIIELRLIAAPLAAIAAVVLLLFVGYKAQRFAPLFYLSQKYEMNIFDVELVEYNEGHFYEDPMIPIFPAYSKFVWRYEYEDKIFTVTRMRGKLYDDYQLEEVAGWIIEYLQENVDERIVGIKLDSRFLYHTVEDYRYRFGTGMRGKLKQEKIPVYMRGVNSVDAIYLKYDNFDALKEKEQNGDSEEYLAVKEEVLSKYNKVLPLMETLYLVNEKIEFGRINLPIDGDESEPYDTSWFNATDIHKDASEAERYKNIIY